MNELKCIELYVNYLNNKERREQRERAEKRKKTRAKRIIKENNKRAEIIPFGIDKIAIPKYKLNLARYYTKLYLLEYFRIAEIRAKNRNF